MALQSTFDLLSVDDFYFSALFDEEEVGNQDLPVSDEKYAEELQFQEAIIASLVTAQMFREPSSSSSSAALDASKDQEIVKFDEEPTEEDDAGAFPAKKTYKSSKRVFEMCVEMKVDEEMFQETAKLNKEPVDDDDDDGAVAANETGESSKRFCKICEQRKEDEVIQETAKLNEEPVDGDAPVSAKEAGESSKRVCEICVERKEVGEMFQLKKCSHSFCNDCISKHVVTKIQDSKNVVLCPSLYCESVIEIESCRSVIPQDLVSRWDEILCESLIVASQKYYCPFKDCSVLLVNDSEEVIRESVCPVCHRLFCAQCNVSWHPGIECEEFQKLNEDERGKEDLMAMELAKEKSWKRCPNCRFYVERNEGCLHMTCRCGFQFCYACGATWTSTHGGCQG